MTEPNLLVCPVASSTIWDGRPGPHSTQKVKHLFKGARYHCIYCDRVFSDRPDWSPFSDALINLEVKAMEAAGAMYDLRQAFDGIGQYVIYEEP